MRLDRDEFIVDYDSTQIGEAELLAIVKKAGYTSSIVANNESSPPVDGDSGSRDDPIFVEALARAKKENKPLVLDFYADWCTPCLKMLKTTIPDPKVAALLKKCVFLKVDTDKHPELAKSFGVVGLPDIRFLAPDGTEKKRLRDFLDAESFAAELEELLASLEQKESAALGIETRPPTAEEIKAFELPNIKRHPQGRVLTVIVENGPAAKAGLMPGDVLLALDDNTVYSSDDIRDFLRVFQPGERVQALVKRASTQIEQAVTVTLDVESVSFEGEHFTWQYAGLGQFDVALAYALRDRKLVLVGLSGADT